MQKAMGSAAKALQSAVAHDGFAFVHGGEMRECLASFGALDDWSAFADSWNRPRARHLHGRRRPLPAAPPCGVYRDTPRARSRAAAPAALPDARLQPAERRHRALVRADAPIRSAAARACGRSWRSAAGCSVRWRRPRGPGTSRSTSSGSRRAPASTAGRRPKACTATASTTCWCCWSTGATSRSGHDDDHALDGRALGSFTLTAAVRRRARRRRARRPRRDAGYAGGSPIASVSRRAGGDVRRRLVRCRRFDTRVTSTPAPRTLC